MGGGPVVQGEDRLGFPFFTRESSSAMCGELRHELLGRQMLCRARRCALPGPSGARLAVRRRLGPEAEPASAGQGVSQQGGTTRHAPPLGRTANASRSSCAKSSAEPGGPSAGASWRVAKAIRAPRTAATEARARTEA